MRLCKLLLCAIPLLAGCTAQVEVVTDPVSQSIQSTSLGVPVYAEVAINIPAEARGPLEELEVEVLTATGQIRNASRATTMTLGLRLSLEGTAQPGTVFVFTDLNRPSYFARTTTLLADQQYAAGTTTAFQIPQAALLPVLTQERVWLIVSNTVNSLGLGETFPQRIDLSQVTVRAVVSKSFQRLGGVQDLSGL